MAQEDPVDLDYIKLTSAEDHVFLVHRNCAMVSGTIRSMLTGFEGASFIEKESNEITFREIPAVILEKVIQYFYYKVKYSNSTGQIPEFPIEPEIALELLMAANFLDT
jgi:hypothetical protein